MEKGKKNIVLIGFMGCGKTTLGKKTASRLGYHFIDTDRIIEQEQGCSVSHLFQTKGEPYFRQLEQNTARKISSLSGQVIATGGGMIKSKATMDFLSQNGIIVYLKATPEHIYRNIGEDKSRPLLQVDDKMKKIRILMAERIPVYEQYAQVTVNIAGGTVNQITDRILDALEGKL